MRFKKWLGTLLIIVSILLFIYQIYTDLINNKIPFSGYPRYDAFDYLILIFPLLFIVGYSLIADLSKRTKKIIKTVCVLIITFLVVSILFNIVTRATNFQICGELINHIETNEKVVALTFDNPNPSTIDQLLELFDKQNIKVTFFVTGKYIEEHPEYIKIIKEKGHELGNSSYSHTRMIYENPNFIRQEIEKTDQLLQQIGVKDEILFRAPYGRKFIVLPYILSKMNKKDILWDIDPHDYDKTNPDEISKYVIEQVKPGSIVLLHNRKQTLMALEVMVKELKVKGYSFKTISEMLKYNKL